MVLRGQAIAVHYGISCAAWIFMAIDVSFYHFFKSNNFAVKINRKTIDNKVPSNVK